MRAPESNRITAVPLRSVRLDLEPLRLDDAAELAVALADPALHAFIGGAPLPEPELRARYARLLAGSPDPDVSWCNWTLRLREDEERTGMAEPEVVTDAVAVADAVAVVVGTVQVTVTPGSAEVAWVVGTPWQGRGLAREAAVVLTGWLRERGVPRLVAHVHPEHHASAAVAAAAGLAPTEVFHDGERRWEWHRQVLEPFTQPLPTPVHCSRIPPAGPHHENGVSVCE
ncbi:GNAT family N-acetyltransferase [Streptomyces sp. NPDC006339]|uniref:GNAT family N-acetyltransferase n=1 Tax=Streptomyces sp. NPDC006339 TaxID=3156755 RepID=UPI0033B9912F